MKSSTLVVIIIAGMVLTVAADCKRGWESFQGSCYIFITEDLSYYDALTICNAEGYDLLEVTSEAENTHMKNLVTARKVAAVWLGMNNLFNQGQWVYSSNGSPLTYTKLTKPKTQQERCMQLAADGTWSNEFCGKANFFICEVQE
ncbi:CD209 antigen-like protein A [Pomacea canaliculata]|uniref:CD209 antigen-like protein A n=1 Tax=Pomacea canaliculata TaxID=400727 RepID=UPI000D73686F|nr:CD209 antigen-like protein A [Pomacea canaliculata]XP_025099853.1 CD209 antigen-like protein A [Pomacea canaliculata]